jgi:hypothetical protein
MSRASKSVKFPDLGRVVLGLQIGNGFRFGRQGLGEFKIINLLILECARRAGAGSVKTDTVTVLTDTEVGDRARRVKEEDNGGKTATVAVLRGGCARENQKISDFGQARGPTIDNLSIMGHGSGKLVNFTNMAALSVQQEVT